MHEPKRETRMTPGIVLSTADLELIAALEAAGGTVIVVTEKESA